MNREETTAQHGFTTFCNFERLQVKLVKDVWTYHNFTDFEGNRNITFAFILNYESIAEFHFSFFVFIDLMKENFLTCHVATGSRIKIPQMIVIQFVCSLKK